MTVKTKSCFVSFSLQKNLRRALLDNRRGPSRPASCTHSGRPPGGPAGKPLPLRYPELQSLEENSDKEGFLVFADWQRLKIFLIYILFFTGWQSSSQGSLQWNSRTINRKTKLVCFAIHLLSIETISSASCWGPQPTTFPVPCSVCLLPQPRWQSSAQVPKWGRSWPIASADQANRNGELEQPTDMQGSCPALLVLEGRQEERTQGQQKNQPQAAATVNCCRGFAAPPFLLHQQRSGPSAGGQCRRAHFHGRSSKAERQRARQGVPVGFWLILLYEAFRICQLIFISFSALI